MNERPYPYVPKKPLRETPFSKKWGMLASELAAEEGTTSAAIHMRVMHHGTPFQRKKLPTMCEVMTGKTAIQVAHELNITPCSVYERLRSYGDPTMEFDLPGPSATRGTTRAEKHWSETDQGGVYKGAKDGWLHPKHPDYYTWRYKYIQKYCPTAKNEEDKSQ